MQKYLATTWRLWKLLKPFHKDFYIQLLFSITTEAIAVLNVLAISKVLNYIIIKDFTKAYLYLFYWLLSNILFMILSYLSSRHANRKIDYTIQQFLEEYSFKKIFKLNISQYMEDHSSIKLQTINRGEMAVENIVSSFILEILPTVITILFSLAAISYYSISIALWCLVTLMITVIWTNIFTNYHNPLIKKDMDNSDIQRKIRSEIFQHLVLIKNLSVEISYLKKYLKHRFSVMEYRMDTWLKQINHMNKRWAFFGFSRFGSNVILIYLAASNVITVGAIYAIWQWVNDVYSNIRTITVLMRKIPLNFIELDKYLSIIDKEPNFIEESSIKFVDGDITFTNFSFKYPKGDDSVLKDLNITLPRGKKIAFVGHSGSGKTTITRLLLRAYDYTEGSIKIGKRELREIDTNSLRTAIGYVEQHVDLFDDTVKNNILLGVSEKNMKKAEKELESVAKLARIDEFYHRLGEAKFETQIGERGVKLSGGERQRIGIARAIIKNPSILIFDEATSALDTINEKYIKEAIDNVSQDRTTIIIAHRLSTVQNSDLIVVMDSGKIVAHGTHTALLESSSHYQDLVNHQLSE